MAHTLIKIETYTATCWSKIELTDEEVELYYENPKKYYEDNADYLEEHMQITREKVKTTNLEHFIQDDVCLE